MSKDEIIQMIEQMIQNSRDQISPSTVPEAVLVLEFEIRTFESVIDAINDRDGEGIK